MGSIESFECISLKFLLIIFNPDFMYVVTYSAQITENGLTPFRKNKIIDLDA